MPHIVLEQLHFDTWKTQSDIDDSRDVEAYEMSDKEYDDFLELLKENKGEK